jgi:hypothetical protein
MPARKSLHMLPIAALDPLTQIDVPALSDRVGQLRPMGSSGWTDRFNFDGYVTFSGPEAGNQSAYLQVFRNGTMEAVHAFSTGESKSIPSLWYELELIRVVQGHVTLLQQLRCDPPVFIMVTLLGVKGFTMGVEPGRFLFAEQHPIDRDILLLPEVLLEDYSSQPRKLLRGVFDAVWQAAGWSRSDNYNQAGEWVGS